ncbi:MAG: YeeE/YedE family protein [Candidatus Rokuibacteriota bacterium]
MLLGGGTIALGAAYGPRQGGLFLLGAGCGVALHHAAFGFTAAYRALVTTGDGRGLRAQLVMLAVATVLFAPVLAGGRGLGVDVAGALAPASVSVLIGAFIFAIGMQLGGGCGSGTLFHLGSGRLPLAVTLLGFLAGSLIATFHMPFWWSLLSLGDVSLGLTLGWTPAVALQLAILGVIALASLRRDRVRVNAYAGQSSVWIRAVRGGWPLSAGAVALAVLNLATLLVAGHPWTITWAFSLWGAKIVQAAGFDLSSTPFWAGEFQRAALAAPVFADVTSIMDMGLVLGAGLAAGLAGRFGSGARRPAPRLMAAALVGGLLLGYGARIAYGCNIGAMFSGIASTSLHGWLWGAAALLGTPVGVRLRRLLRPD